MTKPHTRDLSAARPRGCGSIHSIKPIVPQYTPEQVELFKKLVSAQEGEVFTTSRQIAELFEKEHRNVLRAIRLLECDEEFSALNFELTDFIDKNGNPRPEYLITKDGMVFLVMGFTGKQAAQFKLLYIRAFNWMAKQIRIAHELTNWQHDFTRREAVSVANGTVHGQGLARRRIEKHALIQEQAAIYAKLQLCLNLIGEEAA
ncbi:Rha family transcriptional regulator [Aeromonas veronii]|uniref:Rha family transcriptional regulator n=1 Tax=Aeromonas veronii TaxID=654 RepID=UPI00217DB936|nr:Rha family transcriptional regulator [Aeromonas veronii]UWH29746.1 Rha family transcriptional regulator [Aeromonas veronii]